MNINEFPSLSAHVRCSRWHCGAIVSRWIVSRGKIEVIDEHVTRPLFNCHCFSINLVSHCGPCPIANIIYTTLRFLPDAVLSLLRIDTLHLNQYVLLRGKEEGNKLHLSPLSYFLSLSPFTSPDRVPFHTIDLRLSQCLCQFSTVEWLSITRRKRRQGR